MHIPCLQACRSGRLSSLCSVRQRQGCISEIISASKANCVKIHISADHGIADWNDSISLAEVRPRNVEKMEEMLTEIEVPRDDPSGSWDCKSWVETMVHALRKAGQICRWNWSEVRNQSGVMGREEDRDT